jgi:chromosome partitioning protein
MYVEAPFMNLLLDAPPTIEASTPPLVHATNERVASPAVVASLDEIIAVVHTKGGAGKSSLTTNLSYALSRRGYRVLVVDLDRQTGQSVGFGLGSIRTTTAGGPADVGAVLRGDVTLDEAVVRNVHPGLDVLPADERSLLRAERALVRDGVDGQIRLAEVLHQASGRWDIVLIDTPGRQTEIVGVALAAATGVLVPAIPEGGPVAELSTVLNEVNVVREQLGQLEVYGLVRMRVGGNSRYRQLAEAQTKEIAQSFGVPVFRNKVPEDARFGESQLAREPIGSYAPSARSAVAFRYLAEELVARRKWTRPERSLDAPVNFVLSSAPEGPAHD